jgi:nucleotide-binding universal stress UspA family protein
MSAYQTIVVGTDGSESSLRAVDRAGEIAAESDAKLVIVTGYFPHSDDLRAADNLRDEGYKVRGNAPIYAILREARERAKAAGAKDIDERPISDAPVHALVDIAEEVRADLLVVGNVGLTAVLGRLFSVPGSVSSRAKSDVLIVHTTS